METAGGHAVSLLASLNHQRERDHLCDCVLRQRQDPARLYPAHKCVLAASSPVLAAILSSTGSLVDLLAPCLADSVLELVLDFIYTGAVPSARSGQQYKNLLAAACLLEMEQLRDVLAMSPPKEMNDANPANDTIRDSDGRVTLADAFSRKIPGKDALFNTTHLDRGSRYSTSEICAPVPVIRHGSEVITSPRNLRAAAMEEEPSANKRSSDESTREESLGLDPAEIFLPEGSYARKYPTAHLEDHRGPAVLTKQHECVKVLHTHLRVDHPLRADDDLVVSSPSDRSGDEREGGRLATSRLPDGRSERERAAGPPLSCPKAHVDSTAHSSASTLAPFKCSLCPRAFRQRGTLNRHMRSHLGVRPFPCPRCPMSFSRQYRVTEHMRIHQRCGDSAKRYCL
ncbi:uncharacterized protein LOC144093026 [Stigmatopora argus]